MEIDNNMDEENLDNQKKEKSSEQNIQNQLPELTQTDMLSSKIVELENNVLQYKDQALRKAAEFENYKKRIENETANIIRYANEDLIEKMLPVLDDFERFFLALKEANVENESFVKGIELIYNKLKRTLELQGVKPLNAVGQPFNPEFHDALLQMPSEEYPDHTVMQEVEKGYMLHERVIRHAKVVVSTKQQNDEEPLKNNLSETD
ncbi:MAG: nucleotide exchange factor GrpE [Ignavibacteriales bacterium]|nr:nucleotide exchange factor GrpE [Ignavibacteriales bacterium]